MKIAVIGGGVSGLTFAINRKRLHPEDEIYVFEHTDKLMKKILATGNGKCNIANSGEIKSKYNSEIAYSIVDVYSYEHQKLFLDSLNIKTKLMGDLSYPVSESAVTVRNAYLKAIESLGIKVKLNEELIDYSNKELTTTSGKYQFDSLVFAFGGKSLPKSGSDGSLFFLLKKHGYKINELNPALCPIYTKEKTKILDGTRVKAEVTLLENGKEIFKEAGEVLFKERGLSGIVIFNASRIIARDINKKYVIKIDLLPEFTAKSLTDYLNSHDKETLLESYLHPNLVKYLLDRDGDVINNIKSLSFTFDKLYGFENSQITVGGVSLEEIKTPLMSKRENNVFFIGEALDIDAPCGGYNLMWAIGSALYLSEVI